MDDWGSDGPIFGPYEFAHTTYAWIIKLGRADGDCDELYVYEEMVFYDGVYYGDWSIFNLTTLEKGKYELTVFDPDKSKLPK
jgi:hypothetical protein